MQYRHTHTHARGSAPYFSARLPFFHQLPALFFPSTLRCRFKTSSSASPFTVPLTAAHMCVPEQRSCVRVCWLSVYVYLVGLRRNLSAAYIINLNASSSVQALYILGRVRAFDSMQQCTTSARWWTTQPELKWVEYFEWIFTSRSMEAYDQRTFPIGFSNWNEFQCLAIKVNLNMSQLFILFYWRFLNKNFSFFLKSQFSVIKMNNSISNRLNIFNDWIVQLKLLSMH